MKRWRNTLHAEVLLVTIDALRADHVDYHGHGRDTTPIIGEYASRGSQFMNAFAHLGNTQYLSQVLLSGVTPFMYGGYDRVSEGQTLISEVFQNADYRTDRFHSNLHLSAHFGYEWGFDEFFESASDRRPGYRI